MNFKALWFFVRPFLRIFLSDLGPILAEAAMRAVRVAASKYNGQDGQAKRDLAFAEIKNDLKAKGHEVSANTINAAIESAYARLQKELE